MTDTFPTDPPFRLDESVAKDARALRRLETEQIAWLGSVGRNGYPHAVPVWFLWHDGAVIVFSQPSAAKVKNLRANPKAMVHLEAGADGEQMHVLQGIAEIAPEPAAEWLEKHGLLDDYLAKYAQGIAGLGWDAEKMFADYSAVVVFRPGKLIAY